VKLVTNRKNMDELGKELLKVLFEKYLKKKIKTDKMAREEN
jgi:hypothetical protein